MTSHTFFLQTYGCKTNQYETQGVREALCAAGLRETAQPADAEIILVNTCVVTGRAAERCRDDLLALHAQNPRARLILTGCAADTREGWLADLPFEKTFRNREKGQIAAYLLSASAVTAPAANAAADPFAFSLRRFAGHTRAFLKIQDGCDNFCSYCIIPQARGEPCSRSLREILHEAGELIAGGHRELVLTGINIGRYHSDSHDFASLVAKLAELPGLLRLRLGSIEPQELTPALLAVIAANPCICPHLHLPLQAGDDRILAAMNRKYTVADFLRSLDAIRARLDRPAITTDLIVGFPGEDAASFTQTMQTVQSAGFAGMHLFTFSPRAGTPAATLPPCAQKEIRARRTKLSALAQEQAAIYARSLVGYEEAVIVQRRTGGAWSGHCARYLRTTVSGAAEHVRGDLVRVGITAYEGAMLSAQVR